MSVSVSAPPSSISERHARLVALAGTYPTQKAFSEAIGIGESRLSKALSGVSVTERKLLPVEHAVSERNLWSRLSGSDGGHGKPPKVSADTSAETGPDMEDLDSGDLIEIPTAPYGHAASFDITVDNTDAGVGKSYFQEATLRAMLGGAEIPRDADGRIALRFSFAVGDSMAPFIPDGQPFIYRTGGGFVDGARYALWLGSTQADVIKRVEVIGRGVVHLRSDNSNIRTKVLRTGEEEGTWLNEDGELYDLEIRGQVVWPLDTPAAVVGQITDRLTQLAMSALRGGIA